MFKRLTPLVLALLSLSPAWPAAQAPERWVTTWATAANWRPAPAAPPAAAPAGAPVVQVKEQTLRQIVRTSIKGDRVRVVFSNVHGTLPMMLGAAHVSVRDKAAVVKSGGQSLTFGGRRGVIIPAGAVVFSDPVNLSVAAMADLAIDTYLPGDTNTWSSPLTIHRGAYTTSYVSTAGNHVGMAEFPVAATLNMWWLLARVEVVAAAPARTIVMFGDSITDGTGSTPDANSRWPDILSRRLQSSPATASVAIANLAIAGNRVLSEASPNFGVNALARFDRDVLAQPNAAWVVVLEGINDLGMGQPQTRPSAEDVIVGYRQLIDRAHAHGLKIYGATLTPFEGAAYFSAEGETKRQAINQWIRTSQAFDAVIDFDRVTRDPAAPTKFQPAYDSGDHLHPNDAGYKAMGESIDLALFR